MSVKVLKNFTGIKMKPGEEIHQCSTRVQSAVEQLKVKCHIFVRSKLPSGYEDMKFGDVAKLENDGLESIAAHMLLAGADDRHRQLVQDMESLHS